MSKSARTLDFRLVVCFDICAPTLKEAYIIMRDALTMGDKPLVWETSDEWYSQEADEAGDPLELQEAIIAAFNES